MLQYIFGRAASGKTERIFALLQAAVEENGENAILLVPEQVTFDSERSLLRRLGRAASKQVEVLSFTRLCDRVGREVGGLAGRRIDDGGRALVMGQALREVAGELRLYGRQADSTEFVRAMLSTVAELKQCAVAPAQLAQAAALLPDDSLKAKTADLSLIYAAYDALLCRRYVDPLDDLTRLYHILEEYPYFKGKRVFLDAFKGFTGQQFGILDRILAQATDVYISLNIDPAAGKRAAGFSDRERERQEGPSLFTNVEAAVRRISALARGHRTPIQEPILLTHSFFPNPSLAALEEGLVRPGREPAPDRAGEGVCIAAAASPYEEAEMAARAIRRLVREEGFRYREIAVIVRSLAPYEGVLESSMERYGIPCFMDKRQPVDTLPLPVLLCSALEAAAGYSTEAILRYLKTGLTPVKEEETAELEDYLYIWGLTGEEWLRPFTRNPEGYTDPDAPPDEDQAGRIKQRLDRLDAIRQKAVEPLRRLHNTLRVGGARAIAEGLWRLLSDLDAANRLRRYALRLERDGEPECADLQRKSWDMVMDILDQMALAEEEGKEPMQARRFAELFRLVLSLQDAGGIPQKLDQVTVGTADRMRPGRPRAVLVLGMNQGRFPALPGNGGMLRPDERARLHALGVPVTENWLTDAIEENYLLYTALTAPTERLFLFFSLADNRGARLEPSPAIERVRYLLPDSTLWEPSRRLTLDQLETASPALEQLAAHWGEDTSLTRALRHVLSRREEDTAGRLLAVERAAAQQPARLKEETARRLFGEHIRASATQVDVYHRCRFSYFCRYGLRAKRLRPADLDVLQRGTVVHYVLEKMIRRYGADLKRTEPAERAVDIHRLTMEYLDRAMGGEDKAPPRLRYMLGRVEDLLGDLLTRMAEEFAAADFQPAACELVIGEDGAVPPAEIGLQEGKLSISGAVDRLDVWNRGTRQYIRVVDYKTGSRTFYLSDVLSGLNLQMLLYLFILEDRKTPYAVETGEGADVGTAEEPAAAGVLYMPSKRVMGEPGDDGKSLRRKGRMNGLLLDEPEVLRAMERDGEGLYIPVQYGKKDGQPLRSAPLAGEGDFALLRLHIRSLLRKMGDTLHEGDIGADPLDGRDSGACKYCDFRSVCGREPARANRRVERLSDREALNRMREEETDGV